MRRLLRRVRCFLGWHTPTHGYRFVAAAHPRYRYEVGCLFCPKTWEVTRAP